MKICFTVDLEDPSGEYSPNGRYVDMSRRMLDFCDEYKRKATFFSTGMVARSAPSLIKEISARGHEVAYHTRRHIKLTNENPERFRRETAEDCDLFRQITGKKLAGFRAPRFSLTPNSVWALDILAGLGFKYSSSVMPTNISLFRFPSAPTRPFKWPNGMVEIPLPVSSNVPHVPYSGGIYLYLMPFVIARHFFETAGKEALLWTYTHPYDFDREEKFAPMFDTPLWANAVLRISRISAESKIRKILAMSEGGTMEEMIKEEAI